MGLNTRNFTKASSIARTTFANVRVETVIKGFSDTYFLSLNLCSDISKVNSGNSICLLQILKLVTLTGNLMNQDKELDKVTNNQYPKYIIYSIRRL